MLTTIVITLLALVIFKWIWDRKKSLRTFKEIGIPGPKPDMIFGNFSTITKQGFYCCLDNWLKQYGKTFGYFEGGQPVLVTTDLDIAKQVLIKEFNKFHSRNNRIFPSYFSKHTNVLFADGGTWRRLRSISSPTFSASKMKEMSPLVNSCVDNFLSLLQDHCDGAPFNIHGEYQRLTMDTIANCAFGLETSCMQDGDSSFLKTGRAAFTALMKPTLYLKIGFFLQLLSPTFFKILNTFKTLLMPNQILEYLYSVSRSVILQRQKAQSVDRVDFVQLMIKARETGLKTEQMAIDLDKDDDEYTIDKKIQIQGKGLSLEEMESQSLVFMLAGFETTSTALAFLSYQLALNPHVQEKLRLEVDEHFPDAGKCRPDYSSVQKLEYLDMVLKEALRINPPAVRAVNRTCMEDCTVKGLHIPKGTNVFVYNLGIHMDPDVWGPEHPNQFVPERFSSARKGEVDPLAWMPFGAGPRNCIGMRFALLEVKIAVARILKQYEIHTCDKTQVPLPVSNIALRSPSEGIYLTVSKRQ